MPRTAVRTSVLEYRPMLNSDEVPSRSTLDVVNGILETFPADLQPLREGAARVAFEIDLIRSHVAPGSRIADVGSGWGLLPLGLAAFGMRPILVDDFRDPGHDDRKNYDMMRAVWSAAGVEVVSRDVIADGLGVAAGSLDAVVTVDSIEHWHNSPKRLLHEIAETLKPGGLLMIGAPNCANARKRISLLIGRGKWTQMSDWYEQDVFRGHVREPDVDDLRYIARDLGLTGVTVHGRNFLGNHSSRPALVRALTPIADRLLRMRPSLCSNIYITGRTPKSGV